MPSLQTVSGSGDFREASLISFSYAEDASPISPANLNGGTGQVTAQLVQNESSRGSRIAINNEALLSDEEFGDINFTIKKLSLNEGLVTVIGSTVQQKFDVTRTALPQGSDAGGYTLATAIYDYCKLAGVDEEGNPLYPPHYETGLEEKLDLIDVDFIGWEGNVWEYLKMLCSAFPIDDDGTLMEMYVVNDELWFREALSATLDTQSLISSESITIDAYDASQTVKVAKYSTDYRADSLVQQQNIDSLNYANLELVSITDSFQVKANEKITRRVLLNASLESIEQPIAVQSVALPITYSQYVIVGKNDVPLTPDQWNGQGGLVEVALTENPYEIEITITGANYPELEPFKIGVESSGGEDYPAFYLRGTGVFFNRTEETLYTGAPQSEIGEAPLIDNPFIVSDEIFWSAAPRITRQLCGPSFKLSQSIPTGVEFGTTTGSIVQAFDSKFRVDKTSFNQSGVTLEASSYVTFADFDAAWSGDDISDFNTSMNGLTFNEFSIAALTKE